MRCAPHALTLEIQLGVGLALLPCERSCVLGLGLLLIASARFVFPWGSLLLGGLSSRCHWLWLVPGGDFWEGQVEPSSWQQCLNRLEDPTQFC